MTILLKKLEENNISLENMIENANLKLQGLLPWKLSDVVQICSLLHTNDISIFFQLDDKTN